MNGELAQLCALVSHGTAFLSGQCIGPPRLFEANWTFEFVRSVRFQLESGSSGDSKGAWFTALRAGGCQRMSLAIPRYDEVTKRFYAAMLEAVQSAVNAFQA